MTRLLLVPLLALLACADPYRGLSDEAARAAYLDAAQAGDSDRALDVLKSRSRAGDLMATAQLADAYETGRITVTADDRFTTYLAVPTYPWEAFRWRARLRAAVQTGARAGDREALFLHASALTAVRFENRKIIEPDSASREAGLLILRSLADAGDDRAMIALAFKSPHVFRSRPDSPEATAWLEHAEAAGNPQACALLAMKDRLAAPDLSADALVHALDRTRACDALAERDPPRYETYTPAWTSVAESVRQLGIEAARGNEQADSLLQELDARGVFERYPTLAAAAP